MGDCGCNKSGEVAQLKNMVADLNDIVNNIVAQTKFIVEGHPILLVTEQSDVDCFNFANGYGTGKWTGWAVMGGYTINNPVTKKQVVLPNWTDRFIVMAGGNYTNGDTGGAASVQLTAIQNGQHTHAVTDPGHNHSVSDPGHNHSGSSTEITPSATTQPHSHGVSDPGHYHTGNSTDGAPDGIFGIVDTSNAGSPLGTYQTSTQGTGVTVNDASVVVEVSPFTPTVSVNSNTTNISTVSAKTNVTVADSGQGQPHENRPPYYAAIYVQKIW